jgi:glutamate/tyrosine decarboxylase-like PLP-dependent enzyme
MTDWKPLLSRTADLAEGWLETTDGRRVAPLTPTADLRDAIGRDLPETGDDPLSIVEALARAAEPGLVSSAGPRYFGFVVGGSLPASLAADWLVSAWDQNAGAFVMSPAVALIEETVARWVLELTGLPTGASVGFTTGATMANLTGLAAARGAVLERAGWDVEANGLNGAPPIRLIAGDEIHATALSALRLLGMGSRSAIRVAADGQGRMRPDALREVLARGGGGPTIVCAQAGNVNSGAIDPFEEIADATREAGAWLHVDGAFGLWAAASPSLRPRVAGIERADSWATDAHKWLNVPYDCGIAIVAEPRAHHRAMSFAAAYLPAAEVDRDSYDWVPEGSRRARAVPLYAGLRSLGRRGLAELVERNCALARRFAEQLAAEPGVRILNDVVLNQVLVRFDARDTSGGETGATVPATGADSAPGDARTRAVIAAVQADGTMWAGGTVWHGLAAMRISVSNWSTSEADVDRSVEAILRSARAIPG